MIVLLFKPKNRTKVTKTPDHPVKKQNIGMRRDNDLLANACDQNKLAVTTREALTVCFKTNDAKKK